MRRKVPPVTISQYLRLIRERWITIALLTALGATGAAGFAHLQTPQYQAQAQLFVSTRAEGSDLSQLTQGVSFSQQRVKSYVDLITSPRVMADVIARLRLRTTPEELAVRVSASSPLDTVLLNISVQDASPARARDIANAVALAFPALVDRLENSGGATSPVSVSITRAAALPEVPVAPRVELDVALGLLVGLGLGVGAAVLRDSLDRSVTDRDQAAELVGAPVLGAVGDDPGTARDPLITSDPFAARAEAYRQVRTNIRFLAVDRAVRSLVVTGSVPSEGKTTVAANLALAIANGGESVVLVDADLRRPSIGDLFGIAGGVGLTSVLIGSVPVWDALQSWRPDLPLRVLTAGPIPPNPSELIGSARMGELIATLTAAGNTVVVDSPPLLPVTDAAVLARATDGALLVTRVGSTQSDQLSAATESLRQAGAAVLGVVLNRVPRRGRRAGYESARYSAYRPTTPTADGPERAGSATAAHGDGGPSGPERRTRRAARAARTAALQTANHVGRRANVTIDLDAVERSAPTVLFDPPPLAAEPAPADPEPEASPVTAPDADLSDPDAPDCESATEPDLAPAPIVRPGSFSRSLAETTAALAATRPAAGSLRSPVPPPPASTAGAGAGSAGAPRRPEPLDALIPPSDPDRSER
jgi:capsular exopolysaccharide synthesis family protein